MNEQSFISVYRVGSANIGNTVVLYGYVKHIYYIKETIYDKLFACIINRRCVKRRT
jgi:hypothetical protein